MKKLFLLFVITAFYFITNNADAQLSGAKSIPGDYSTIKEAVTDLDSQGVGLGGVTFNVAAGHTETSSNIVISITSNQPTSSNQVIFQKSGAGANPLITAAPGVSTDYDGIIKLSGADYITFDRIDLLDPNTNVGNGVMEWGYALLRASDTDGSQHNVIKNCVITLQKISALSYGIYIINRDTNGTVITATTDDGQNNSNRFFGNNISNVYKGIVVIASSTTRDSDNEIGVIGENPNTITNWGGSTIATQGIRCEGQINVRINNNIINGGNGTANSVVGIIATLFGTSALAPNYEIAYNVVTVNANQSSSETFGIRALATADTILIHDNIVENCVTFHSTSAFTAITHDAVGISNAAYIYNNIVRNNSHSGTGTANLLEAVADLNYLSIHSNQIYDNQKSGASGTMNCIVAADATLYCDSNLVYDNSIPNSSGTAASNVYGYANTGSPVVENVFNNTIYNLSVGGFSTSTSALTVGIRTNAATASVKNIYDNTIYGLSTITGRLTTGGIYGIYSTAGNSINIYKNKIYDITNNSSAGTAGGIWISTGSNFNINNNFISEIKAPNSNEANAVIGINSSTTTTNSSIGIYFNSINLSASGGLTFGSSGISVNGNATATTANLDMRNNIINNLSSPGSSSGVTTAFRRSNTSLTNFSDLSDNNNFYSGTPSANRLIFFDGINSDQTLAAYQTRVAPRDANSTDITVNFVDPANGDLHLTGGSVLDPNLAGHPVSGISEDIDGDLRNDCCPYKGADESTPFPVLNLTVNLEACSPMQDTITASIRSINSPYNLIDSDKKFLSPTGTASLCFPNAVNSVNYYVVVNHRNSIETWSKNGGEIFTGGVLNFDFTTAASQAFGNNQVLVSGKNSFYTGDVNQDEIVDLTDLGLIDNDAFGFETGYIVTDLNCDNIVDVTDAAFADNNASAFVAVAKP